MKPRLKMDGFLLALLVICSLGIYFFPSVFLYYRQLDNGCDFWGMLLILKGSFIRMSARGHKLTRSPQGMGLAQDGLYAYTRNPMYLGTFLIGCGFVLIAWPWWMVFIFAGLFYLRFNPLIRFEQKHLQKIFGQTYEDYCHRIPAFFPSIGSFLSMNHRVECPWAELWSTKESRIIWALPLIALVAETLQEIWFYHAAPTVNTFLPLVLADGLFAFVMAYEYFWKYGKNSK